MSDAPTPSERAETKTYTDEEWRRDVYRGDQAPQLTVRAVVAGMVIGGVLSLTNLYVSLRTGWSFGVTITAALLAFGLFGALRGIGLTKTSLGLLENNAMQSVASAAGYMTGGGTVAVIPGLMLLTGTVMPSWQVFTWIVALAFLGIFVAVPMKRQMINREQLRFPSGVAAAELLQTLYPAQDSEASAAKAREARNQSLSLLISALLAAVYTWFRNTHARYHLGFGVPESIAFPGRLRGIELARWTISLDTSLVLVSGGALMGWRAAWSLLFGAALNYGLLAPHGFDSGAIPQDAVGYRNIVNYTLWFGSSLLLTAGLLALFAQPGTFERSLASLRGRRDVSRVDPLADIEVPLSWALRGVLVMAPVVIVLAQLFFGMSWWVSLICIVLSFFLAIVAARSTGETDTTPSGSLAKVAQLTSGGIAPGSVISNLVSANIAAGIAIHASDLLTDLKAGYIVGANARKQFFGQFFGVVAGSACVVPAMALLVPDPSVIGTEAVPAPAAISWTAVARVMSEGLSHMSSDIRVLIALGAVTGIAMLAFERFFPKAKPYFPSAIGFGLAFTLPASNAISMFIGAAIVRVLERSSPELARRYVVPVASGVLAGESLTGVFIAFLQTFGVITP